MPPTDLKVHLDRLRMTARDLVALVSGADAVALHREPEPGEWSAATVVGHLADAELVYAVRLRMIVAESRPVITPYDENAWADRLGEIEEDVKETLARWRVLRDSTLRLLDGLVDDEWDRSGVHQQRGVVTVASIVKTLAEHDRTHLDQIRHALA
jgi:hypothetical protein